MQLNTLTATKQETYKRLRQVLRQGQSTVNLMRTGARKHFGNDSELLVEFGVNPFRSRARTPPETPNPEHPESPAPPPEATE